METRLNILEQMYQEEAVKYIAGRYGLTPEQIVIHQSNNFGKYTIKMVQNYE